MKRQIGTLIVVFCDIKGEKKDEKNNNRSGFYLYQGRLL